MQIFTSDTPLTWGKLNLPLMGLSKDWFDNELGSPSTFTLAKDPENLWFITIFPNDSLIHPSALPGKFTPELWKYDVGELFVANPATGEYLEFNLTANSAWWASKFSSVRTPSPHQPDFQQSIRTKLDSASGSHSIAALIIPLIFLKKEIDFGVSSIANITFIRNSPDQRFLSASKLPGIEPDFHQPKHFHSLSSTPLQ